MSASSSTDGERTAGPRSAKGARTRARLVDAAKQVFEETGFLDARISDIAGRADLSHGSFYHYFESKEEIFLEVARAQDARFSADSLVQSGLVDATTDGTVAARLGVAVRRYLETYRTEAPIMGVIEQVSRYHEPLRQLRAAQQRPYLDQVEDAIRALQARGWADPGLDPTLAASALIGMMTRFAEMWFVQGSLDADFEAGVASLTSVCATAIGLTERS